MMDVLIWQYYRIFVFSVKMVRKISMKKLQLNVLPNFFCSANPVLLGSCSMLFSAVSGAAGILQPCIFQRWGNKPRSVLLGGDGLFLFLCMLSTAVTQ